MQRLFEKTKKTLSTLPPFSISPLGWLLSFFGTIAIREFIESFVAAKANTSEELIVDYFQNIYFALISILLLWIFTSLFLKTNPKKFLALFTIGIWLMILPPALDMLKTRGSVYWSFYMLGNLTYLKLQFFSFLSHFPSGIVYFGSKIVILISVLAIGLFIYIKTKNIIKGLIGAFFSYCILFFMGSFPSWLTFIYYFFEKSKKPTTIDSMDIIQFMGVPTRFFGINFDNMKYALAHNLNLVYFLLTLFLLFWLFFLINKSVLFALLKNARLPQIIYHGGLLFIGLGLGYLIYPNNFNPSFFQILAILILLLSVYLAWLASVVFNDLSDYSIDLISNNTRPLQKNTIPKQLYLELGIIMFILSIIGGLMISPKFAGLFIIYQFIAFIYSSPPLRLKRFPILATFISAIASLIIVFIGFTLFSGDQNLQNLSWRIIFLFLISFTISLPIKDFKDIAGDKSDQIWTIPVIFGDKNGRIIVAINVFISFLLSIFLLNVFSLFWWALLFGSLSFLVVIVATPKKLFWYILFLVILYGFILVNNLFLGIF